jgi:anthranilate phosphoribosyltransferase
MIAEAIRKLTLGQTLDPDEARQATVDMMSGNASQAQMAAFLTALRMKGETAAELAAMAKTLREFCVKVNSNSVFPIVDTCGTGGATRKTFNVSTTTAFVIAGAGVAVAKHGNRGFTSKTGSADVLEALGVNITAGPEKAATLLSNRGVAFLFAPVYHPAMKHVAQVRRELGIRTAFNLLGPISNPVKVHGHVLGVSDPGHLDLLAQVLMALDGREAIIVNSTGVDEISPSEETRAIRLHDGEAQHITLCPEDFGLRKTSYPQVRRSPEESSLDLLAILSSRLQTDDPRYAMVLMNSAAGLLASGQADTLKEGVEQARESVSSGKAHQKLKDLVSISGGDPGKLQMLESKVDSQRVG